jgi:putative transposase
MPWSEGRVDERRRLIALWETGWTITELARRFGVSRPTVYHAVARFTDEGENGLCDLSRRPHSNGRQTSASVTAALLNMKDRYPRYGPDKLVRMLRDDGIALAATTAGDILSRNGRVQARRARPARWSPTSSPTVVVPTAGHSMSGDHKGQFRMLNGRYCHALTIADPASRYVFAIEALSSTSVASAIKVFTRVFREWGLPEQIITDNGNPFCAARATGGLTALSKLWIRLGIHHARIQPGRPQQNGIHERMHRTLKEDATQPPGRNLQMQQRMFDRFQVEFNTVRPHEALGQERPVTRVASYRRPYPERLPPLEYPSLFEVRSVMPNGCIKWKGERFFISQVLAGEKVALQQIAEQQWALYFGPVHLATWDAARGKFLSPTASL